METRKDYESEEDRFVDSYLPPGIRERYGVGKVTDPTKDKGKIRKALDKGLFRIIFGSDPTLA